MSLRVRFAATTAILVTLVVVGLGVAVVGGFQSNLDASLDQRINHVAQLIASELGSNSITYESLTTTVNSVGGGLYVITRRVNGAELAIGGTTRTTSIPTVPASSWPTSSTSPKYVDTTVGNAQPARFALQLLSPPVTVTAQGTVTRLSAIGVGALMSAVDTPVSDLIRTLAIMGGIALAIAVGVSWIVAGRVSRPVAVLSLAAAAVATEGDLSRRVPEVKGPPETRRLASTFNAALEHIQTMYTALESVLVKQRRFIRDASHELRTPLTTMSSTLETMALHPDMDARSRSMVVESALAEARRMARLIDGLLTLAAYDSGERLVRASFEWTNVLEGAARDAIQTISPRSVIVDVDDTLGAGWGDAQALRQLLDACIDNVHEHTPHGTTMTLSAHAAEDGGVVLAVSDDGPGVGTEIIGSLAERFVQADPSRAGEASGLGLAIAHAIASGHGGTLNITAVEPHGLRVVATIPPGVMATTPERRRAPRPA